MFVHRAMSRSSSCAASPAPIATMIANPAIMTVRRSTISYSAGAVTWTDSRRGVSGAGPSMLRAHELAVRHAMRLIRIGPLAAPEILDVRLVVALVPHRLAVALEREHVRRDAIQEPAIVRDHDDAAGEVEQRVLERAQ